MSKNKSTKPNSEIILTKEDIDKNIITKYGTYSEELKPKVVYLRTKAKITPIIVKQTFEEDIDKIKNDFIEYISSEIIKHKNIDNNFLSNIDISSKSVKFGKISFLRYDIYLKPSKLTTLEKNQKMFTRLSIKFDKKLIKLLNKHNIKCL